MHVVTSTLEAILFLSFESDGETRCIYTPADLFPCPFPQELPTSFFCFFLSLPLFLSSFACLSVYLYPSLYLYIHLPTTYTYLCQYIPFIQRRVLPISIELYNLSVQIDPLIYSRVLISSYVHLSTQTLSIYRLPIYVSLCNYLLAFSVPRSSFFSFLPFVSISVHLPGCEHRS